MLGISLVRPDPDRIPSWSRCVQDCGMIGSENEGIIACIREIELSRRSLVNIVSEKKQVGSEPDAL